MAKTQEKETAMFPIWLHREYLGTEIQIQEPLFILEKKKTKSLDLKQKLTNKIH